MVVTPLISVILPCFNVERFLDEALDSIVSQTYRDLEIICIDDGSSDSTLEILKKYADRDKRIVLVENGKNLGLIDTLNKGVLLAKGEFIARMDADDISLKNRFAKQLDFMMNNSNVDIMSGSFARIDESGKILKNQESICISPIGCEFASFFFTPINHPSMFCKAIVLKENPYVKTGQSLHCEDYELWSRLIRRSYFFSNLKQPISNIRVNSQSVSRKFEAIQVENFVTLVNEHYIKSGYPIVNRNVIRILCLSINRHCNSKDLIEAMSIKKSLVNYYRSLDGSNKSEIDKIDYFVSLSILFQGIKRGNLYYSFFSLLLLLVAFRLFAKIPIYLKYR